MGRRARRTYALTLITATTLLLVVGSGATGQPGAACDHTTVDPGYQTEAAARAAVTAADHTPTCVAIPDPAQPGLPAPHPNAYHYVGHQTTNPALRAEGIYGEIEVTDPAVDNRAATDGVPYEFHAARVMSVASSGRWIEGGWAETSWFPTEDQCAYAYYGDYANPPAPGANTWYTFCGTFNLQVGGIYPFKIEQQGANGTLQVQALMLYNGSWWVLAETTLMRCANPDGTSNCEEHAYYEVYSDDTDPHEVIGGASNSPDGGGISFRNLKIRVIATDSYDPWKSTWKALYREYLPPYDYCDYTKNSKFEAHYATSGNCTNP